MGADIYYESKLTKLASKLLNEWFDEEDEVKKDEKYLKYKKVSDERDEAGDYFRDSYNNSSVFWQMGLSWWRDVSPVLDEEGNLPIAEAMKLWEYIEKHPIVREEMKFKNLDDEEVVLTEKEKDEWFEYFTEKRKRLMDMLDRSIKNNNPLSCSV